MFYRFLTSILMLVVFGISPLCLNARENCKDYGGYTPRTTGQAYENACRSSCFNPCLTIGLIAIASAITVAVLGCNNKSCNVVIHAHSD